MGCLKINIFYPHIEQLQKNVMYVKQNLLSCFKNINLQCSYLIYCITTLNVLL